MILIRFFEKYCRIILGLKKLLAKNLKSIFNWINFKIFFKKKKDFLKLCRKVKP